MGSSSNDRQSKLTSAGGNEFGQANKVLKNDLLFSDRDVNSVFYISPKAWMKSI